MAAVGDALERLEFPAGAAVVVQDDPGDTAYLLLSGTFKVDLTNTQGHRVVLAFLGPGEIVGELNAVDHLGRSANVTTLEPAVALALDATALQEFRQRSPALAENMLHILARRLRLANAQVLALATLDPYGRLAHQLLSFAEAYGQTDAEGRIAIPLRLSQEDLADMTGDTAAQVGKIMAVFRRNEVVAVDDEHRVTILDRDTLVRHCA